MSRSSAIPSAWFVGRVELPPLVVITPRALDGNEAPAVRKATNAYFESMTARNNAAVADAVKKTC